MVADHVRSYNKHKELRDNPPVCNKCGYDKVELVAWIKDIEWECEYCGHRMYEDMP